MSVSDRERARLRAFSLSYNAIGDEGAMALAATLPGTLAELGLVGCAIGDVGGQAILKWAATAGELRMICIEDNAMTHEMRRKFTDLRKTSDQISVFV